MTDILIGTWAWGSGVNGSLMIFGNKQDPDILKASFEEAVKVALTPEEIDMLSKEALATGIRQQGSWEPQ